MNMDPLEHDTIRNHFIKQGQTGRSQQRPTLFFAENLSDQPAPFSSRSHLFMIVICKLDAKHGNGEGTYYHSKIRKGI